MPVTLSVSGLALSAPAPGPAPVPPPPAPGVGPAPSAPTLFKPTTPGAGQAQLTWRLPTTLMNKQPATGGNAVTAMTIYYNTGATAALAIDACRPGASGIQSISILNPAQVSRLVTGLATGIWAFTLSATNTYDEGTTSAPVSIAVA